jgi:hypothetical protein
MNNDSNFTEKCLKPGNYNEQLENWFEIVPVESILVIDFKKIFVEVQNFLSNKNIDLSVKKISDDYCYELSNLTNACFSWPRNFDKIDEFSKEYLKNYYKESNTILKLSLEKYKFQIPFWLNN